MRYPFCVCFFFFFFFFSHIFFLVGQASKSPAPFPPFPYQFLRTLPCLFTTIHREIGLFSHILASVAMFRQKRPQRSFQLLFLAFPLTGGVFTYRLTSTSYFGVAPSFLAKELFYVSLRPGPVFLSAWSIGLPCARRYPFILPKTYDLKDELTPPLRTGSFFFFPSSFFFLFEIRSSLASFPPDFSVFILFQEPWIAGPSPDPAEARPFSFSPYQRRRTQLHRRDAPPPNGFVSSGPASPIPFFLIPMMKLSFSLQSLLPVTVAPWLECFRYLSFLLIFFQCFSAGIPA